MDFCRDCVIKFFNPIVALLVQLIDCSFDVRDFFVVALLAISEDARFNIEFVNQYDRFVARFDVPNQKVIVASNEDDLGAIDVKIRNNQIVEILFGVVDQRVVLQVGSGDTWTQNFKPSTEKAEGAPPFSIGVSLCTAWSKPAPTAVRKS